MPELYRLACGNWDMIVLLRLNSESESILGGPELRIFSLSLTSAKWLLGNWSAKDMFLLSPWYC